MTNLADEMEAIRHTMAAYNIAGDRLRLDDLADAFADDGVLEIPTGRLEGRAAIVRGLGGGGEPADPERGSRRRPSFVRHNLTTSLLELTGADMAAGRTYFIVFTDVGPDHMGCYVDKLRKVAGRWLFEHRRVLIDWMSEDSLFEGLLTAYRARLAARAAQPQ
jgi:hypothetical protein